MGDSYQYIRIKGVSCGRLWREIPLIYQAVIVTITGIISEYNRYRFLRSR